jgi:hypothetical protein
MKMKEKMKSTQVLTNNLFTVFEDCENKILLHGYVKERNILLMIGRKEE